MGIPEHVLFMVLSLSNLAIRRYQAFVQFSIMAKGMPVTLVMRELGHSGRMYGCYPRRVVELQRVGPGRRSMSLKIAPNLKQEVGFLLHLG